MQGAAQRGRKLWAFPKAFGSDGVHTRRLPVRSVGSARDWRQHVPRRSPAVGWRTHLAPWPCPMQPNPHPPPTCHSNQSRAVGWLLTIDGARRRVKKGPPQRCAAAVECTRAWAQYKRVSWRWSWRWSCSRNWANEVRARVSPTSAGLGPSPKSSLLTLAFQLGF